VTAILRRRAVSPPLAPGELDTIGDDPDHFRPDSQELVSNFLKVLAGVPTGIDHYQDAIGNRG
jgi:hypothetical protein